MWKKLLVFSVVTALLPLLASCSSAEKVVEGVVQSLHEIGTYQYDMNTTINMAGVVEDEAGDITIDIDLNGTVDNINRRMWMEMELAMLVTLPEEEKMVVSIEMYFIGNDAYMLIEAEDETLPWFKERMPVGSWDEIAKLDTDVAILEEAVVTLVGSEKIRGIDCYVLEIIPNEERLLDAANQDTIVEELFLTFMEELTRELIEDVSVKQWVEKDTLFLAKTEITMEGEVLPDVLGDEAEGMLTVNMTITSSIFNYNEPFNIELPTEAEEAIPWDTFLGAGETEAAETEFMNIQTAVILMMVDNELVYLPNPVTVATNDMGAFPDTSVCGVDKIADRDVNAYQSGDKDGYILYQHDITADNTQTNLVNYITTQYTTGTYTVDSLGTVTQVTTGFE